MNITELELKYKELGSEIERLKQAENDGKPKMGQTYWWLDSELDHDDDTWHNARGDIARWQAGNVYKTEQEAINAREVKLAIVQINREIVRLNKLDGFVAFFTDCSQGKYYPMFDFKHGKWCTDLAYYIKAQFTFEHGSQETIKSVFKSHAKDFEIVKNGGVI